MTANGVAARRTCPLCEAMCGLTLEVSGDLLPVPNVDRTQFLPPRTGMFCSTATRECLSQQ